MGLSTSAATAIIGVAILLSFELIVAEVIPSITDTNDSYDLMKKRSLDQIQTDINISNVNTPSNASNYDLNITVKNTGSISLKTEDFNILVNGTKHDFSCSKNYLHPEKEVFFNVTNLPGSGSRRLKLITENGISDYYTYAIS